MSKLNTTAPAKSDRNSPVDWDDEFIKVTSSPAPASPVPMDWRKRDINLLRKLVAADPAAESSELAKQFKAKRGIARVNGPEIARACEYYGIERAQGGKSERKFERMAWSKPRVKVLRDLVAAAPATKPSDLAKQLNAVIGCKVTAKMVADACSYYGIPRLRESDLPKPQPWTDEEMVALRDWFATVRLPSVSLDQVTRRMREITGREVLLTELPDSLLRRVFRLRIFLMLHHIRPVPGAVPAQVQRELAARRAMVEWLDHGELVKALGRIIKEAVTWCSRPPGQEDPAELETYDPELPEAWWDPGTFLENVLEGLEDELHRQFEKAGMHKRREEVMVKIKAAYDAEFGPDEGAAARLGAAARVSGSTGSLFDPLDEPTLSGSTTGTHAIKSVGLQQDRPVISAGS